MKQLLKAGCWTAAIAGFLFVGANVHAQGRTVARTLTFNPNLYRQQSLVRPFIAPQQARIVNPAFTSPAFSNFNRFGFTNSSFNPHAGYANFNRAGYYNPCLGNTNFNQTGYVNPYLGYPTFNQAGFYNPSLGYPNFNQTGVYNPYAFPGYFPPTVSGFLPPFFGY